MPTDNPDRSDRTEPEERPPPHDAIRPSLQERFESSPIGRGVLSGLFVFVIVGIVLVNLPTSEIKRRALPVFQPYLDVSGLTQNWELFGPNPRRRSLRIEAAILFHDGARATWRTPKGGPPFGLYRTYRWRKLSNNLVLPRNSRLLAPAAAWIARQHRRNGRLPAQVTLVAVYSDPGPTMSRVRQPKTSREVLQVSRFGGTGPKVR